jgi:hypothetical protein
MYYIKLLKSITPDKWISVYTEFKNKRIPQLVENNSVDLKGNKLPLKQNNRINEILILQLSNTNSLNYNLSQ